MYESISLKHQCNTSTMNYIFSQHLILIIIQYTHSIVVEFVATKVSGVMSEGL